MAKQYPECPVEDYDDSNTYYEIKTSYDNILRELDLDIKNNHSSKIWNPFGDFIKQGHIVLLKPNFVRHFHGGGGNVNSVLTNTAILKITLDYVFRALRGTGRVIVGDASLQTANFNKIIEICRLHELEEYYKKRGFSFEIKDLRKVTAIKDKKGNIYGRKSINLDTDFIEVNLRDKSFFGAVREKSARLRVTDINNEMMINFHNMIDHKYLIHKDALNADVIINLPKAKTHRKAGFTCAMKNLIGINGHKGYLPHHTAGAKEDGGDEYLQNNRLRKLSAFISEIISRVSYWKCNRNVIVGIEYLLKIARKFFNTIARWIGPADNFNEGCWHGNDTIWRTIADLNIISYFCDKDGQLTGQQQRVVFSLVDGIVAGDRDGPMAPRERAVGLLSGGFSTYLVDYAMAAIMGFDVNKIPFISKIKNHDKENLFLDADDPVFVVNGGTISYDKLLSKYNMHFEPSSGWKGHLEI